MIGRRKGGEWDDSDSDDVGGVLPPPLTRSTLSNEMCSDDGESGDSAGGDASYKWLRIGARIVYNGEQKGVCVRQYEHGGRDGADPDHKVLCGHWWIALDEADELGRKQVLCAPDTLSKSADKKAVLGRAFVAPVALP